MGDAAGASDQQTPANTFTCRSCTELVHYSPTRVPGALKRLAAGQPRERTVYLRCANGHLHPYTVVA